MAMFSSVSHGVIRLGLGLLTASSLTAVSWASLLAIDMVNMCDSAALANHHRSRDDRFSRDARDGRDGQDGRNGRNGQSQTIGATGDPIRLDLSATDGEDGGDGEDAEWIRCRRQPRDQRHDLQAANGGDGGDGGNGGNGGNGGDLTIHYLNPSDLRQILVTAEGGRGGRGGRGGDGTDGCECDDHHWTVEVCQDGTCKLEEYECDDGHDGGDGSNGSKGETGTLGRLMLINQTDPLPSESPRLSRSVSALANQTITLSRNLWETRSGATTLLAPGSTVADSYEAYAGHIERQFRLDWQADHPFQSFSDAVSLELQPKGDVQLAFPETYWLLGESVQQDTLITYRVDHLVPVDQVTQLAVGRVDGRSRTFTVNVVDLAQQSDVLETRFEVRYSTSGDDSRRRRYDLEFEGPVPANLIQQDHNRFTLSLGRLPIRSQVLSGGTQAQVELKIIRSFGSNSAEQTLTWQGKI